MADESAPPRAPLALPPAYRGDIEGMRAVAVLMVLALHAGLPLAGGFVGVDVFFVLSGFLITSLLLEEFVRTRTVSLAGFYARRARRLLPAVAVVLAATAVLTVAFLPHGRWRGVGFDILASGTYVQNWRLAALSVDYRAQGGPVSPLQHFWSLGVEEQFYLIWPLLLILAGVLLRRSRLHRGSMRRGDPGLRNQTFGRLLGAMVVIAAGSFAWSVWYTHSNPAGAYFVTTTRLWELAAGGILALVAARLSGMPRWLGGVLGWAGLAAVIGSAVVYDGSTAFPGWLAVVPVAGTLGMLAGGLPDSAPGPRLLLDRAPFRWVGRLSYSLYLWHWPLLVIAAARFGALSEREGAAVVVASAIPAYLSFRLVEDPIRRAAYFKRSPVHSLDLGVLATAMAVAVALAFLAVSPPPPPVVPITVALDRKADERAPRVGAEVLRADPRNDPAGAPRKTAGSIYPAPDEATNDIGPGYCSTDILGVEVRTCAGGDTESPVDVVLVGDSHAQQWTTPLYTVASARKWKLTGYTKSGCPLTSVQVGLAVDAQGQAMTARAYHECATWRERVLKRLTGSHRPDLVILSWGQHYPFGGGAPTTGLAAIRAWMTGGDRTTIKRFLDSGIPVVVLADTPAPAQSIPDCVQQHLRDLTRCTTPRSKARQDRSTLVAAARSLGKQVTVIDLTYAICPTKRCAPVIGGVMVWRDNSHLTASYAATLAPRLNRLLPKIAP